MFGRRKRQAAEAAEAVREADRVALFAKLAERPEHICPFLGLAGERAGYVEGVSDEHRCFAFGDPAPLSAEQQTRVCQERGYGNCPRYLRGVLVIPTDELEALRRPRAAAAMPPPPSPVRPVERRRRRGASPILLLVAAILLLVGGVGAYVFFNRENGTAIDSSPSASPTPAATATATATGTASGTPSATASASPTPDNGGPATPTPEPTPQAGDEFAFYEVSVGPENYTLYALDAAGDVVDERGTSFGNFSFARVEPREGSDGRVYWETQDGSLAGWSYLYPDSGNFRVRAVFFNPDGERRSEYLSEDELTEMPEATPAP